MLLWKKKHLWKLVTKSEFSIESWFHAIFLKRNLVPGNFCIFLARESYRFIIYPYIIKKKLDKIVESVNFIRNVPYSYHLNKWKINFVVLSTLIKCLCGLIQLYKMQIRTVIILKLLLLWQGIALTEQQLDIPRSPCPRLFQYKYNGNDWYGELELPSPPIQPGEIILTLILTLRAATTVSQIHIICFQLNRTLCGRSAAHEAHFKFKCTLFTERIASI